MKKRIMVVLLALIAMVMLCFGLTACNFGGKGGDNSTEHTHEYNQEVVDDEYLKSGADCTHKAIYYYSCICGQNGSKTFEFGNFKHAYNSGTCANCGKLQGDGLEYTLSKDGTYYSVSMGTCTDADICIPETYNYRPVTSIGGYAFSEKGLTSITISKSVTSIATTAFIFCKGLTSITIASDNTKYHSSGDCLIETGNKTLILGCRNSLIPSDGSVTRIGENAFLGCEGLTSIMIPNSVTSIGKEAFDKCKRLASLLIPDSVTSIGDYAFSDCTGLTSVTIGNSVTSIGKSAFSDCTGLKSIAIPDSVASLGESAFDCCAELMVVTIGNSVPSIGFETFRSCTKLTNVTIGNSVTIIGARAFRGCIKITKVELPNSVACIDQEAFDSTGLTSIEIPKSVTSIDSSAFIGCSGLTSITVANDNTKYHSVNNCLIETANKTLILGCKNSIIPSDGSVTSIGSGAFFGCIGLKNIGIPNSVTSIGSTAFLGCTGLTSIRFYDTKSQWNAVSKGNSWDSDTGAYTVHCTDGDIVKS